MKKLLVDYLPFEVEPDQINESMKENGGKVIVRGVLQRAESKNQNGRVYPKDILVREAKKYTDEFILSDGPSVSAKSSLNCLALCVLNFSVIIAAIFV